MRRISFCDPKPASASCFDKQFRAPCGNIARLQKALAGRTVFQVDQTELASSILRHVGERRKTQIWTAVCVYVLAAIIKRELALNVSLILFYRFCQSLIRKIELSRFQDVDTEIHPRNP